ncbi:MAG: galactokinase [Ignavibacteria bacterium]|nr:MAG: galactokinase [Ignavibacteria bacterium]KAF0158314.1 MAG: galactokinase [Ignavibacteria bacterium]
MNRLSVSAPGRICMFGEHQDYLNLPIIAAAITKRFFVVGAARKDKQVTISLLDLNSNESFGLSENIPYIVERDYLRSSVNVLMREGFTFSRGFDVTMSGNIPINAGTSSSSAMIIAWINFLTQMSDQKITLDAKEIAQFGYIAEVLEFGEPGGMMDQYSSSIGGVIWLESFPEIHLESIYPKLGSFVLGNSQEPKDTKFILSRVKKMVINIINDLKKKNPVFSLQNIRIEELDRYRDDLNQEQLELLQGTIRNRDITFEAKQVLITEQLNHQRIGRLMNEHQNVLRNVLQISTPKINKMIDAALNAGAYGAKINGSGGGGCMFAYAPENTENVLEAVKSIAPESWIVNVDDGTKNGEAV